MNITAIITSPHGMSGNTGKLLTPLIEALCERRADVLLFSLAEKKVEPCRACDVCHKTGKCSIEDDFGEIKSALDSSDGIVLASPNYISSVSAQAKALLDRCCGAIHCQSFAGKYAAAVVTSGSEESKVVEDYILHALRATGCWTVGSVGAAAWQLAREPARTERIRAAAQLGRDLFEAIQAAKSYPEQMPFLQSFANRMKQLITMHKGDWQFEYNYWKSTGKL